VSDIARGLIALVETRGIGGEAVSLGCPEARTVLKITEISASLVGSPCQIDGAPLFVDDPAPLPGHRQGTMLLGWQPEMALETGLEQILTYFHAGLALSRGAEA
jgi:nucleoside-diphosphate-sugar epimerase